MTVCNYGSWLYHLCEAAVPVSDTRAKVHRTGSQDVKWGKQGHTGTHKDGLESALVSPHSQIPGAIHCGVKHTPYPRVREAEQTI